MSRVWVFDLDDTLYLERDYVASGFRAVDEWALAVLGLCGLFDAAWALFEAGARRTTLSQAFEALGRPLDQTTAAETVRIYRSHRPCIRLCPDAARLLGALKGANRIGLITDGPAGSQRAKLDALGLNAIADSIVVTAEHGLNWPKPGLGAFAAMQAEFAAEASRCVYIADNPVKDFQAPRSLGWSTVRIVRPLGLHALAPSHPGQVERTVSVLTELAVDLEPV